LSEFDLHARAVMGLPVRRVTMLYPAAASAVTLADREAMEFRYEGIAEAPALGGEDDEVDVRMFGKPVTRVNRRMGVVLATGTGRDGARIAATEGASRIHIGAWRFGAD
jgi:phosphoribosylglycinamide formyltransferase 2